MTEFALGVPNEEDVADAMETLADVLRLDSLGEIDLPPYLTRLLLQLEETLSVAPTQPAIRA
jgi:hypothetical protein